METGDVVLTPGWCWHGHGHDGDAARLLVRRARRAAHPSSRADVLPGAPGEAREGRARGSDISVPLHARATSRAGSMPRNPTAMASTVRAVTLEAPTMPPMGLMMERLSVGSRHATLSHHRQHHLPCHRRLGRKHGRRQALCLEAWRHFRRAGLARHQPPRHIGRAVVRDVRRATAAVLELLPVRGAGLRLPT